MRHLKVLLGRLVRICQREIAKAKLSLSARQQEILNKIKKIQVQSILSKAEKEQYKEENKILYSFHAPEVECIGKGKLNKPYEFGNKVSIAVSGRGNFVLGTKSFHGNPYDGHTLSETVEIVKELTGVEVARTFVD
ncbi:hypothetical protein [Candidatus Tisiphia endosymbiont of Parasteatoda lunata]